MTRQQQEWLRNNKAFQVEGSRLAPGDRAVKRGMLHPDGTFEEKLSRNQRTTVREGSFEVVQIERGAGGGLPNVARP